MKRFSIDDCSAAAAEGMIDAGAGVAVSSSSFHPLAAFEFDTTLSARSNRPSPGLHIPVPRRRKDSWLRALIVAATCKYRANDNEAAAASVQSTRQPDV